MFRLYEDPNTSAVRRVPREVERLAIFGEAGRGRDRGIQKGYTGRGFSIGASQVTA
jgi:hypothetical protein